MSASESARGAWFQDARFGLFVHWGLYAVLGRGEWIRNRESVPDDEYESLVQSFDAAEFDTREWARMAKQAGMRYAVLTTKHHEGFCLWD
jgi:alpha-L-fucosidase